MLLHKKRLFATEDNRKIYDRFTEAGVIARYEADRVAGQQTCSQCSDGFRLHMKEHSLETCARNGGDSVFYHAFQGNGEAMRFAMDSPLSKGYSTITPDILGRIKTTEIVEVLEWADELEVDVTQHRLLHHWPCKAATSRGITFAQSIDLVIRGKARIKHQIGAIKVAIDLFCDWGPHDHTIDLIKKEPYLALIENDPEFRAEYDAWQNYMKKLHSLPRLR